MTTIIEISSGNDWITTVLSVVAGGLITLLIQYFVIMRNERKTREHDRTLALADRAEDKAFTRLRADQDRWERWADELGDVATGDLVDAGPAWAGSLIQLRRFWEDMPSDDPGRVPDSMDAEFQRALRMVSRVGIRISTLIERVTSRPGAPAADLGAVNDAKLRFEKAFMAILVADGTTRSPRRLHGRTNHLAADGSQTTTYSRLLNSRPCE